MDLACPYLTEQLIAYIGNKRSLLPFLHGVFSDLAPDPVHSVFLDPFAGSGSVSRLARLMGFTVFANDWERYAQVINGCHLCVSASELGALFPAHGGLDRLLLHLNSLPSLPDTDAYIARHYAPRETAQADWRTERLFYTRENAQKIDTLRTAIEEMYPGTPAHSRAAREKLILLAPLLYEAATHTNTSGVFKACHKGFGGHGRDALTRILAPIRLRVPVLVDASGAGEVSCTNAAEFLKGRPGDVCYLDPPYATHQYGSNYFMLNSLALWDKPPVSDERGPDGRFLHKAGIRADWTATRSAFCYRETAMPALREVVEAADCRRLVVSYSNEGLIGVEEMCDLLAETGSLRVISTPYVKYPGGKQSLSRTIRNREIAFVVDREGPRSAQNARAAPAAALTVELMQILSGSFHPRRIHAAFPCDRGSITVDPGAGERVTLPMRHYWRFAGEPEVARLGAGGGAEEFLARLRACAVLDVKEEIGVIRDLAATVADASERAALLREALRLLNRLAHRKNATAFVDALAILRPCGPLAAPALRFEERLDAVEAKARLRADGSRAQVEKEMPR